MRIVLLGTLGQFPAAAFRGLVTRPGISTVALPGSASAHPDWQLPVQVTGEATTLATLARDAGVPTLHLAGPHADAYAPLTGLRPDLIVVACWPWRLPKALYALPRHGCFNLHPSLLPAYRGPDPLFWQFRDGVETTGVSLHSVIGRLDAGPLVLQCEYPLADGITEREATAALGALAGELLEDFLPRLQSGPLTMRDQDESRASAFTWPTAADFRVTAQGPARRAYNFIRGVADRGQIFMVETLDDRRFQASQALSFDKGMTLPVPWKIEHGELHVQCTPGVLRLPAPSAVA